MQKLCQNVFYFVVFVSDEHCYLTSRIYVDKSQHIHQTQHKIVFLKVSIFISRFLILYNTNLTNRYH